MIVMYLSMTGCFAVVLTMMVMFIKHNSAIRENDKRKIARRFMLVFSNKDDLAKINQ